MKLGIFSLKMSLILCLCYTHSARSSPGCGQVILRAVKGRDGTLPCGQGKVFLDGPEAYALWTKDDQYLYRYPQNMDDGGDVKTHLQEMLDMKKHPVACGNLLRDGFRVNVSLTMTPTLVASSCEGEACPDPTSVKLVHVGIHDAGFYRCRIRYQASPAVDFFIELRVVDPPGSPQIFDNAGNDLSGGVLQLPLGSDTALTCKVHDGNPDTIIWWIKNGEAIQRSESIQDGVLQTTVNITNASRSEVNAHYECLVQNADVTTPLSTSVIIKMNLAPISVEIRLNNNLNFEAGVPRVVDCVVVGCVPPPVITWRLGNVMLRPNVHKELHDGNFTVSSLTLALSLRDDNHELTCRAYNYLLPDQIFESVVVLNVGYKPIGVNDHETVIGYVDGQMENATCTVDSYPAPMQFIWTFSDNKKNYTGVRKVDGYEHRYSSNLIWTPQETDKGELLCQASNLFGLQEVPSVYSIVAGGAPQAPDCQVIENNIVTYKVSCIKNWDGGRQQVLHVEVRNVEGKILKKYTHESGHFLITLHSELNQTAKYYSSNSRGRSESKLLSLDSIFIAEKPSAEETEKVSEETEKHYGLGALITVVIIGGLALLARGIAYLEANLAKSPYTNDDVDVESRRTELARLDGAFRREPRVNPVPVEETNLNPNVIITVPSNENVNHLSPTCDELDSSNPLLAMDISPPDKMYVFDPPIERFKKPAKVLGLQEIKLNDVNAFEEMQSYYV